MLLLEFAAQGIRGVSPAGGRATLRPGYNVLAAEGAALRRLLEALLHPDARDAESLPRVVGGPAGAPLRAGLTLVGADRVTYRLVRDFTAGCQLHRFDPVQRAFALVSQDLAEIGEYLARTVGVPTARRGAALLSLVASELPSRTAGAGLAPGGAAAALAPARAALSPEQARRRLADLKAELERSRLAEKLQYQLDGLQSRLFKLEEALKSGQRIQDGLAAAEAERAAQAPVAAVAATLGDPAARLAAFDKACARRDEALRRVEAERAALVEATGEGGLAPVWEDPRFWLGAGGGLALLALGMASAAAGSELRVVALLDLPAFGWAGWLVHRWLDAHQDVERRTRRGKVIDDWEAKIQAQFAHDAAELDGALRTLQLAKPAELRDALDRLAEADGQVAEWHARKAAWEADAETTDALAERAKVDEALKEVETQLAGQAGGFVRDVRTVEMELERTEAEALAPAPPPEAAPGPAAPPRPVAPGGGGDPLRDLLERSAAELGGSPAAVARTIGARAGQALAALTMSRLTGLSADDRGNVQVVSGGRPAPALTLPPADRDLVFLALKLALIEQTITGDKTVAVLEDAFGGLSDATRRTIGRLLKQAAKGGQILHATSDPAFREAADHQA